MRLIITCLLFITISSELWSQSGPDQEAIAVDRSILGKWVTYDIFDSSVPEAVAEIFLKDDLLHIRIDSIIPEEHRENRCVKCTGLQKGKPIKGMLILKGAIYENGKWHGAEILNAKTGKKYGCIIYPTTSNKLKIRGYIGYPLFGKNLYWTRLDSD